MSWFALKICFLCDPCFLFPVLPMNSGLQHRQEGQNEQKRIRWIETFILLNTLLNFSLFQIGIEISNDKGYSPRTHSLLQLNSDLTLNLPGWKVENLLSFRLCDIKRNVKRANLKKSCLLFRWQVQKGTDTCWERCRRADRVPQFPFTNLAEEPCEVQEGRKEGYKSYFGCRDTVRDKGKTG